MQQSHDESGHPFPQLFIPHLKPSLQSLSWSQSPSFSSHGLSFVQQAASAVTPLHGMGLLVQQSHDESGHPFPQLLTPHLKSPLQSLSLSQSPSFSPHGYFELQHEPSAVVASHFLVVILVQQSHDECSHPFPQLSTPHLKPSLQSLSWSQSPSFSSHGLSFVQQELSDVVALHDRLSKQI